MRVVFGEKLQYSCVDVVSRSWIAVVEFLIDIVLRHSVRQQRPFAATCVYVTSCFWTSGIYSWVDVVSYSWIAVAQLLINIILHYSVRHCARIASLRAVGLIVVAKNSVLLRYWTKLLVIVCAPCKL